ncbi:hypothetical protein GQ44DRAFT_824004 [Phaeosphaeriaceae sp. PMI808]|nr:hypothetical protein GQ44DRAFT_824004 [Phaeosphaeriaceae sp. PMI808]
MADDADFYGGRLRLAAFLRVVDNGMPQRPSRFKQRVPLVESQPHELTVHEPSDMEGTDKLSNALRSNLSLVATDIVQTDSQAEAVFELGISRSSTLLDQRIDCDKHDINGRKDRSSVDEKRTRAKATKSSHKNIRDVQIPAGNKSSSPTCKASFTRKRQLPVNGLALMRTTTSDFLPEPCNSSCISAISITDIDPVEDSQLNSTVANRIRVPNFKSQCDLVLGSTINSSRGREPVLCSLYPVKQPTNTFPITQTLSLRNKIKRYPHMGLGFMADGFVGSELKAVSIGKPRQRRKVGLPGAKPSTMVAELTLATGLLPTHVAHHADFLTASGSTLATLDDPSNSNIDAERVDIPVQVISPRNQSVACSIQHQLHQTKRFNRMISKQLSSITAPIRHESENSEAEIITGQQYITQDEGTSETNDTEEAIYSGSSVASTRTPTFRQGHGYFEEAMLYLGTAAEIESNNNEI